MERVIHHPRTLAKGGRPLFGVLLFGLFALVCHAAAALVPVIATVPTAAPARSGVPEYNVKAAYLVNFTRYVVWPEPALSSTNADSPIIIGILGENPFGEILAVLVAGVKSQGRPIQIRFVQNAGQAAQCHLVFIARGQERDEAAWLRALRGKPVLTVTESGEGLENGAVLALALEKSTRGSKVTFYASLPASHEAGLQISALMLASARKVIREPAAPKDQP